MASITEIYTTALKHHRAGEMDRAEGLYREILRIDPSHADANHLLGVAAHQRDKNDLAVEYMSKAIRLDPSVPSYHSNLGAAYRALGHLDRAVESLRNAVRADADYIEGHQNLGVLLGEQGKHDEANRCLERALQLKRSSEAVAAGSHDFVWQGIYQNFDEVPVRGSGHEGNNWAQATFEGNKQLQQVTNSYQTIPFQTLDHHTFLPMMAGIVSQRENTVRILDFGGATGTALCHLHAAVDDPAAIELHVVETESACRLVNNYGRMSRASSFTEPLPTCRARSTSFTSTRRCSTSKTIARCWKSCVLSGRATSLLPRLSAGDFPTYATAQMNLWNDVVAYWFINVGELIGIMKSCGYRLLSKSVEAQMYDQSNFPAEYRMHRACNLLFGLDDAVATGKKE